MKICLVTCISSHYRVKLFEYLAEKFDIQYYFFSDGQLQHWEKKNPVYMGDYDGQILSGFYIGRTRVTLSLIPKLLFGKFDVIIKGINGRFALPVTFVITKIMRKPFILWQPLWHHPDTVFHRISYYFLKFIWKHTDAFVVYGSHVKKYLVDQGISPDKIFIAWNTIDNSLFNGFVPDEELEEIRSKYDLQGKKVILYVGRLAVGKGLRYLLDAYKQINDENSVLFFIGEGPERQILETRAQEENITNIRFLNYIENTKLYHYYALADVFVLPSVSTKVFKEPWGLVVNEAMNQRCPIVASDAVGAAVGGLVENGVNGYVVRERNSGDLAEALRKILSNDELRMRMGEKSLEMIKDWTYPRMAKGFEDAICYATRDR